MKTRIAMHLLLFFVPACAQSHQVTDNSEAQAQVNFLTTRLTHDGVRRIEVIHIPERILTRTRITPKMLEGQFRYKLIINDPGGATYRDDLVNAAKSLIVRPQAEMPDMRWGVILFGDADNRLGGFYFDSTGTSGAVDDTAVSMKGALFNWLVGNFGKCFR